MPLAEDPHGQTVRLVEAQVATDGCALQQAFSYYIATAAALYLKPEHLHDPRVDSTPNEPTVFVTVDGEKTEWRLGHATWTDMMGRYVLLRETTDGQTAAGNYTTRYLLATPAGNGMQPEQRVVIVRHPSDDYDFSHDRLALSMFLENW